MPDAGDDDAEASMNVWMQQLRSSMRPDYALSLPKREATAQLPRSFPFVSRRTCLARCSCRGELSYRAFVGPR